MYFAVEEIFPPHPMGCELGRADTTEKRCVRDSSFHSFSCLFADSKFIHVYFVCKGHRISRRNALTNIQTNRCLGKKELSLLEHPFERQPLRAGTVAKVEACLMECFKDLVGGDLGRRVYLLDGLHHFFGGKEVGGFGRSGSRSVGHLQGIHIDADVGNCGLPLSLRGGGRLFAILFHNSMC